MTSISQPFNEPTIVVSDCDSPFDAGAAAANAACDSTVNRLGETLYDRPTGGPIPGQIDNGDFHGDFYGAHGV